MKKYIAILFIILISCREKEQASKKIIGFTNPEIIEDTASEWIQIDKYFSLNIPDSISIGLVKQIQWTDSLLYIVEDGIYNSVMVFDMDGQLVNRLLKMGTGPGEYSTIDFFMIESDKISIYDRSQKKLIQYDLNDYLNFQDYSVQDYLLGGTFLPSKDGYFLISDAELENNIYKGYGFTTADFSSIKYSPQPAGYIEAFLPQSLFQTDEDLFITQPFSEKIFQIGADSLILETQIDFGNKKLPESVSGMTDAEEFYDLLSTGSYYFAAHNVLFRGNSVAFNFYNESVENVQLALIQNGKAYRFRINSPIEELFLKPLFSSNGFYHTILLPGEYDEAILYNLNISSENYEKPILVSYYLER